MQKKDRLRYASRCSIEGARKRIAPTQGVGFERNGDFTPTIRGDLVRSELSLSATANASRSQGRYLRLLVGRTRCERHTARLMDKFRSCEG
jgi:hypothetical protein